MIRSIRGFWHKFALFWKNKSGAALVCGNFFLPVVLVAQAYLAVATATVISLWAAQPAVRADIRMLRADDDGRFTAVDRRALEMHRQTLAGPASQGPLYGYEPREVLVVEPSADLLRRVSRLDFTVIERLSLVTLAVDLYRLQIPEQNTVPEAIALLRERFPGVVIDANHIFSPSGNAAAGGTKRGSSVRAVTGWGPAADDCGRNVRIGLIDAPVDVDHPALAGQRIEYRSFHNPNRRPAPADHGTAVAAMLIGQASDQGWGGILPGAEVMAANMFEINEDGRLVGNAAALLKALDWMAAERVHMVNLSVAGADNKALRYALQRARKLGLVMVAAAGNWGRADRPAYPAAYDHVIAVTAFGAGGDIYTMANQGAYIDFAAPGVHLWTAVPEGGRFQSGTSFAVPYVSAHIAVEAARGSASGSEALRRLLSRRAVDLGAPGKDDTYGWGFIADEPGCG